MKNTSLLSLFGGLALVLSAGLVVGCGDDSGDDSGAGGDSSDAVAGDERGPGDPGFGSVEMPKWDTDLDPEMTLEEIPDDQIFGLCEELAEVLTGAEEAVACRIAAVAETNDPTTCSELVEACEAAPSEAWEASEVNAAPERMDCAKFTAETKEGCDRPVGELIVCIDALSGSLGPSAEALSCDGAGDFADAEEATGEARFEQDIVSYIGVCKELEACESLVNALLGG